MLEQTQLVTLDVCPQRFALGVSSCCNSGLIPGKETMYFDNARNVVISDMIWRAERHCVPYGLLSLLR